MDWCDPSPHFLLHEDWYWLFRWSAVRLCHSCGFLLASCGLVGSLLGDDLSSFAMLITAAFFLLWIRRMDQFALDAFLTFLWLLTRPEDDGLILKCFWCDDLWTGMCESLLREQRPPPPSMQCPLTQHMCGGCEFPFLSLIFLCVISSLQILSQFWSFLLLS